MILQLVISVTLIDCRFIINSQDFPLIMQRCILCSLTLIKFETLLILFDPPLDISLSMSISTLCSFLLCPFTNYSLILLLITEKHISRRALWKMMFHYADLCCFFCFFFSSLCFKRAHVILSYHWEGLVKGWCCVMCVKTHACGSVNCFERVFCFRFRRFVHLNMAYFWDFSKK